MSVPKKLTSDDYDFIRDNVGMMSHLAFAKHLSVSPALIYDAFKVMGLNHKSNYSNSNLELEYVLNRFERKKIREFNNE